MRRFASIDVGTNTLRLLIAEGDSQGFKSSLLRKNLITRLGGGFDEDNGLHPDSVERTLSGLQQFRHLLVDYQVERVRAVATHVVRKAGNQAFFLAKVKEETGLVMEVIDSKREAQLTLAGVVASLKELQPPFVVFDIGGGSTEFTFVSPLGRPDSVSLPLGVVSLTETYLDSDPPAPEQMAASEREVARLVGHAEAALSCPGKDLDERALALVGCGGTVTTLAAMEQQLADYDPDRVNGFTLSSEQVRKQYRLMAGMPMNRRKELTALEPGREDIILAGCAIVLATMDNFGSERVIVSDAGLLEGVLIELLSREGN